MHCPVCRVDMIVVEYEGIELDYCLECSGVWFDNEELDYMLSTMGLRIEDLSVSEAAPEDLAGRGEKPRPCPLCRKGMKKISAGDASRIILDRCERHGGYWFDGGELAELIKGKMPEGDWEKVAGFVAGLFGPGDDTESID